MLPRVILLLDGLDEVSLNYKDKCLKLDSGPSPNRCLSNLNQSSELELEFTYLAYTIKSFTEKD